MVELKDNNDIFSSMEKRVNVYRNLRNGLWSVKRGGLLYCYAEEIHLKDVKFLVQKKGHENAVETRVRNVHAHASGVPHKIEETSLFNIEVTYNPFGESYFYVKETGDPIYEAEEVLMKNNKVYIKE